MDLLVRSAYTVEHLSSALYSGASGLEDAPKLLKQLLADGSWREFRTRLGDHVSYDLGEFDRFTKTRPLNGLGCDPSLLDRIVADDPEAVVLLREARQGRELAQNGEIGNGRSSCDNITPTHQEEQARGTSASYTTARLKRDHPELWERVKRKELSSNAAAIEAGFRQRTWTAPIDPSDLVRALRRRLEGDEWEFFVKLIKEME